MKAKSKSTSKTIETIAFAIIINDSGIKKRPKKKPRTENNSDVAKY
jgi:hypothetical protein